MVRGKRVVLVDDSIVRGTTSREIVRLLRKAGATQVHMRVTSPPSCTPATTARTSNPGQPDRLPAQPGGIREIIGADSLGYLSVDNVRKIAAPIEERRFCTSCFDGIYPTEAPLPRERDKYTRRLMRVEEMV